MTKLKDKPARSALPPATPSAPAPFRPLAVIGAVFRRNFLGYFSNPVGYVFIVLFMVVSSFVAFWLSSFFANNLANLDTLNYWMPYLLILFVPAITMTIWADERRLGTDELLLTLPARDFEIVLGKYFAALGIYTVALLFSLTHVVILKSLGSPDMGVMLGNYLGYWLMGVMLIALGMLASLLTSSATVAFILGAMFVAVPVFAGFVATPLSRGPRMVVEDLAVPSQFHDLGTGVVSLPSLFYFVSLAAGALYLNMILLGRRHWAGGPAGRSRWAHLLVRAFAVIVALVSLNLIASNAGARWRTDLSAEGLSTLSPESRKLIQEIPADQPVYIQAYYSPEVPREYVQTKSELLNKLREFAARGGARIQLNLVEAERYSPAGRDAEKRFGIMPRRVESRDEGRQGSAEIYLGVAFTSGAEEVVVPFFDLGLPVEYELTRSIRVVTRSKRKKVGILATDAKMLGGMDFKSMGQSPEWGIVTELKKQYEVSSVSADNDLPTDLDALLVAQPSSLTQKQIDNLTAYVRNGGPALLFLDPLPSIDPSISPEEPRMPPGGMFGGGAQPEPKGNLTPLLDLLGIDWNPGQIVWDPYNPTKLADLVPEVVIVGRSDVNPEAFNAKQAITSRLQQVVLLFAGSLRPQGGSGRPEFTPLLKTSEQGGTLAYADTVQKGFMGVSGIRPDRPHIPTGRSYTLAARIDGPLAVEPPGLEEPGKKAPKAAAPKNAHVIAIADLDLISEMFFDLRRRGTEGFNFDNVTFVLNCVDELAGDDAFISLRSRRPQHRTLSSLEADTMAAEKEKQETEKAAEEAAKKQLAEAQSRLDDRVKAVQAMKGVDARTKEIMLANLQEVESRRLTNVIKVDIEDSKRRTIQEGKANAEEKIRRKQNRVRLMAIAAPPLLPLLLGVAIFFVRGNRENRGASPSRMA